MAFSTSFISSYTHTWSSPQRRATSKVYTPGINNAVLAVSWTLCVIAALTVASRLYVRSRVFRKWFLDDWIMLAALACQIWFQVVLHLICDKLVQVSAGDSSAANKIDFYGLIGEVPAMAVSILGRLSGAILLCRIFSKIRWFKTYLIVMSAVQIVLGIITLVFYYAQISPIQAFYDPSVKPTIVIPASVNKNINYPVGIVFIIADLTFVIFPSMIAWKMQISSRRRLGLIFVMSLSIIPAMASVVQIIGLVSNVFAPVASSPLWGAIEQCSVIIIASIPPLLAILNWNTPGVRLLKNVARSVHSTLVRKRSATPNTHDHGHDQAPARAQGDHLVTIGSWRTRPRRGQLDSVDADGVGDAWQSGKYMNMDEITCVSVEEAVSKKSSAGTLYGQSAGGSMSD